MDRTEVQDGAKGVAKEDFDPVIVGPWMDLWDIETDARPDPKNPTATLPNQHVDHYMKNLGLGLQGLTADKVQAETYKKANNW